MKQNDSSVRRIVALVAELVILALIFFTDWVSVSVLFAEKELSLVELFRMINGFDVFGSVLEFDNMEAVRTLFDLLAIVTLALSVVTLVSALNKKSETVCVGGLICAAIVATLVLLAVVILNTEATRQLFGLIDDTVTVRAPLLVVLILGLGSAIYCSAQKKPAKQN